MVLFLKDSGLRVNELVKIKYGDISEEFENGKKFILINIEAEKKNALRRAIIGPEAIQSLKEYFDGTNSQKFFRLNTNETIVNSDNTLYNWLNAYEFHHEEQKKELLSLMHKIFPKEASRAIFVMLLIDKSKAIQVLNGLIRPVIGKVKSVNIDFGSKIIITRA